VGLAVEEIFYNKVFVADGDLYTGTVADFSGMDPIIYREPLQTEQYDSMSLNGEFSKADALLFATVFD
jgi:hypothetical protein